MGHKETPKQEPELDAPPPYSELPGGAPGASTAPASTPQPKQQPQQQPQQTPQAQIRRQFPPAFSVYRESTFARTYTLGEHQNQPLYAISLHSGWSGQPDVVLHSSASDSSPPLAGVECRAFSRQATVDLPPLPGSGRSEELLEHSGFGHGAYNFSIEVGNTGRREPFEWRHSHGAEVDSLGGSSSGWKLIRLATDAPGGVGHGAQFVGGGSQSRDGREVVAVWADARMSLSKILNFRFVGTGATGGLGERWAVMAVITALRIWDRERKARQQSSAA